MELKEPVFDGGLCRETDVLLVVCDGVFILALIGGLFRRARAGLGLFRQMDAEGEPGL